MTVAPRVTVLIPVWNTRDLWLHQCLQSVVEQERASFRMVVIDDGSTDPATLHTLDWAENELDNVSVVRLAENHGVGTAMHYGFQQCTGSEFVTGIGSDDIMTPGRLEVQVDFMRHVNLVSGQVEFMDADGGKLGRSHWYRRADRPWYRQVFDQTVMYRTAYVQALGGYPKVRTAESAKLWRRWHREYGRSGVWISDHVWARYRLHCNSNTYRLRRGPRHLDRWRTE